MTEVALTIGSALLAFGPVLSLFGMIVYQKAQLVIVVTSAAFFFLLAAVGASMIWSIFYAVGLQGALASLLPGIFFQFIGRCAFVGLYHKVEATIMTSLEKQRQEELKEQRENAAAAASTQDTVRPNHRAPTDNWTELAKVRLELNDASSAIAAAVGYGGMHAVLLYGTLLASQTSNNVGVLYQESCPSMPSLVLSACFTCMFTVLDVFWMLFTFFGMRRRLLYHRGEGDNATDTGVGAWFGNSRNGGNVALLTCLITHTVAAIFTATDAFAWGCAVSLPVTGAVVLATAYLFWAGCGRIYMPPPQEGQLHSTGGHVMMTATDPHHMD
jgi:hypothetical protein